MNDLIASFLVQNGECRLSGIGKIHLEIQSAVTDIASKVIQAPEMHYILTEGSDYTSDELVSYIALKLNTDLSHANTLLQNWISESIHLLENGESISLPSAGDLSKNNNGKIVFNDAVDPVHLAPALADRVIHENDTHRVLVGDKESDSEKTNHGIPLHSSSIPNTWWKAAVIIAIISIALYLFYIATGKENKKLQVQDPPPTYILK